MRRPETKFTSVGRDRVAYQVYGEGDIDVLNLKSFGASVDGIHEHPGHLRWQRLMGAKLRVILLDFRGTGMSDALPESRLGDLDGHVDDVIAVLDAVGVDRVSVVGELDGGLTAIKLAVDHPERVDKLVVINAYTDGQRASDDTEARLDTLADLVRGSWGTGEIVAATTPGFASDPDFCARFERMGARPSAAAALVRKYASTDLRPQLGRVAAPTLVVHGADYTTVTPEQSREIARGIPGARLFEGVSSSFYWGGGVIEETVAFLSGTRSTGDRDLATLLFTDVVDSTRSVVDAGDDEWRQILDFLDDLVASRANQARGRVVKQTGDGHLVEFARPSDAVSAAIAICSAAPTLGVALRAGVHTGEIERREDGDIGGLTVHIAARIGALAEAGEVVVSRTVADLLGAGEYDLADRGDHELKGVPGRWSVFAVSS